MYIVSFVRDGMTDTYIGEASMLRYGLSVYDSNCTVVPAGREFGENLYSFGMKKESTWLRVSLTNKLITAMCSSIF